MLAKELRTGDTVRAPWCYDGDDANLTGIVIARKNGKVIVRWNGDGTVTPAGDESVFTFDTQLEKI